MNFKMGENEQYTATCVTNDLGTVCSKSDVFPLSGGIGIGFMLGLVCGLVSFYRLQRKSIKNGK